MQKTAHTDYKQNGDISQITTVFTTRCCGYNTTGYKCHNNRRKAMQSITGSAVNDKRPAIKFNTLVAATHTTHTKKLTH